MEIGILNIHNGIKGRQEKNLQALNFMSKIPIKNTDLPILQNLQTDIVELSKRNINIEKLKSLGINNFRIIESNNVSGGTFAIRPLNDLQQLMDSGIKTIIDFRSEASYVFKNNCKKFGMNYLNIPLEDSLKFFQSKNFIKQKDSGIKISDEFVDNLKTFFDSVNKGNSYMGCHYGIDRTNIGVTINYLLNPKAKLAPQILTWAELRKKSVLNKDIKIAKKILKNLTPEQKSKLGIPENYNEELKYRILRLLAKNKEI